MNNPASYDYKSVRWFEQNQYIPANSPIKQNKDIKIVGFTCALDPELEKHSTTNRSLFHQPKSKS